MKPKPSPIKLSQQLKYYATICIPRIDKNDRYTIINWFGYELVLSNY
jgi:hypothetical protein